MKASLILIFSAVVCVAIYGGCAKASILPLGVVVVAPPGSAAEVATREAGEQLANGLQEAGNQAVAQAQVLADAAGVRAQAVVDAVQAANERLAQNIADAIVAAISPAHAHAPAIVLH